MESPTIILWIIGMIGIVFLSNAIFLILRAVQLNSKSTQAEMLESIIALMPGHVYWVNQQGVYLDIVCTVNTLIKFF